MFELEIEMLKSINRKFELLELYMKSDIDKGTKDFVYQSFVKEIEKDTDVFMNYIQSKKEKSGIRGLQDKT